MAQSFSSPKTMRAWQYSSTKGGLEKNLKLNSSVPLPKPKSNQHLVRVFAAALNPIDYKPAEIPIVGRLMVPKPATPCNDFAGCIVTPAAASPLKAGQLIFGITGNLPIAGGALSEFALVDMESSCPIPEGIKPIDAATIGVAGLTAYQSIVRKVKKGDSVFINGGSGGTGVFGIQMAKAVGCYVTTTCSTTNVDFCKSFGADEVVDYRKENILDALKASNRKFDHAVDNVGHDKDLYWRGHEYLKPEAVFVMVGGEPSWGRVGDSLKRKVWPGALGGFKGNVEGFWPDTKSNDLEKIIEWMKDGKVKFVIDQSFSFEDVPKAFEKLKTGRTKGKIVIDIACETYKETSVTA